MRSDLTKVQSPDSAISYFSPKFFYHFNFIFHNLFFSSTTSNKNGEKASLQALTAPQHYQRAEQHLKKEKKNGENK